MSIITAADVERMAALEYNEHGPGTFAGLDESEREAQVRWAYDLLQGTFPGRCIGDRHVTPHRGCTLR